MSIFLELFQKNTFQLFLTDLWGYFYSYIACPIFCNSRCGFPTQLLLCSAVTTDIQGNKQIWRPEQAETAETDIWVSWQIYTCAVQTAETGADIFTSIDKLSLIGHTNMPQVFKCLAGLCVARTLRVMSSAQLSVDAPLPDQFKLEIVGFF